MSYKVLRWVLKLFLLAQVVSHVYALEAKKRTSPDQQRKTAQAGYNSAKQKQQQILRANAAENNAPAWAGSYYRGNGWDLKVSIALSDEAGVAVTMQGDDGNYEGSIGSVELMSNGHLAIRLEHSITGFESSEYVPTRWAGRMYLIKSDDVARFASDINLGLEPREDKYGIYPLHEGNEKLAATGLPALPPAAVALIRNKPLVVRATSVQLIKLQKYQYGCDRFYRIQIDHGSTAGLAKGVLLNSLKERDQKRITLTEVRPEQAVAGFEDILGTCDRPGQVPVRGELFTTGSYPPAHKSKPDNQQCEKDQSLPAHASSAVHPPH